jgi:lactate permease
MQEQLFTFLSFSPIILLIILSLTTSIRTAAMITFILTSILFLIWENPYINYFATLISSAFSTLNILMIVFGAVFLYEVMKASGYIELINHSIKEIHPRKEVRFFLISIGLTAFFEGVAGFGTPGAIVPLLLISMGFNPVLSVSVVLLFNGLFSAFGAVGTPFAAGLKIPLKLSEMMAAEIAGIAACIIAISGLIILFISAYMYQKEEKSIHALFKILLLYFFMLLPFVFLSPYLQEFTTILSSLVMLFISVLYLSKGKFAFNLKAWLPYIFLVILLLLPKILPPLNQFLDMEIKWAQIFSTDISAFLKPLKSPLIPFILISIFFAKEKNILLQAIKTASTKLLTVSLLLLPVIAVAQLMLNSGSSNPSMINMISESFSKTGSFYTFIAPFIGITGAFITGSTTVSNIVFAPSQMETALLLKLDPSLILSLQLAGGSIGNAICLYNVIAACSVANIRNPKKVLLKNIMPVLLSGFIAGLLIFIYQLI